MTHRHAADLVRRPIRIGAVLLAAVALAASIGCSSARIRGKVVEGEVSFVAIVAPDDPRLGGGGVPGVEVALAAAGIGAGARAVSGPTGDFDISLPWRPGAVGTIAVEAEKEGFVTTEGTFSAVEGNHLLVILRPKAGAEPTGTSGSPPDGN
jgi:hypothetical protein